MCGTNTKSSSRRSRYGTSTPNLCTGIGDFSFPGLSTGTIFNLVFSPLVGFVVASILVVICIRGIV